MKHCSLPWSLYWFCLCVCLLSTPALLLAESASLPAQENSTSHTRYLLMHDAHNFITYTLKHRFHTIQGTAQKSLVGEARLLKVNDDMHLQVHMQVAVKDFDSNNQNRDSHMQEVVEAATFPLVSLKGLVVWVKPAIPPLSAPLNKTPVTLKANLQFHGQRALLDVPVFLTSDGSQRIKVSAKFAILLSTFKIERPSLMFVPVEDTVEIQLEAWFQPVS